MCVEHIYSPVDNAKGKVEHIYTGPSDTKLFDDMINCDQEGKLMVIFSSFMLANYYLFVLETVLILN